MIRNILISMRPYQWAKNVLVFAALFFSLSFLNIQAIQLSVGAFIAFCLVSSGVYLMNDIRDKKADRLHPVKKQAHCFGQPARFYCTFRFIPVDGSWVGAQFYY